ncbi:ThuA domain-containing protein [Luteolibacter algae]|uniref:ThuA domain-containing protein n=1 Tax=Luteolibacter algae TaxID=454151 RepID=A0ABW5D7W8_9BACT
MKNSTKLLAATLAGLFSLPLAHAETKPLRALLLTGGCCHDYKVQKDLLKKGIEERANIVVDQIHTDNNTTAPDLPIYGMPEYAKGYDVVIHDECAAGISDDAVVKAVLAPHKAGIPGVNLHCSMHSYRIGDFKKKVTELGTPTSQWFEYLGIQSTGHGKKTPISIVFTDVEHPITNGAADWTTGDEELYNNVTVFKSAHALAKGQQGDDEFVVAWTNDYQGTRVFSTTIGHMNETVGDPRYLDLVTRGILWACGKIDEKGGIAEGYGLENVEP